MQMKKIRIAQIGTSKWSHGTPIWFTLLRNSDIFDIAGYALPEKEREKFPANVKCFEGYREMTVEEILEDPDIEAVVVETEEIYLTKYALMVAKAGKHLHMEKPGGTSLEDFKELVSILKKKQLVFSLGYMFRFNPAVVEAVERVKNGELGEICAVDAQMSCRHGEELRNWLQAFPGGMMFFLGCHLIDIIYRIQGEPESIIPLNCSSGFDDVAGDDFGMTIFKYPRGVSFAKTTACESGGVARRQLVISGENGTFEIKPLECNYEGDSLYAVLHEYFGKGWHAQQNEKRSEIFDRYDAMIRNFAEMVRGKENPYTYDYELKLYELILRCCKGETQQ